MMNLTKNQFEEKRKKGKIFSIIKEFRGDEITPIAIYNAFTGERKFILESGSKENHFGRYSFLGEDSQFEIVGNDKNTLDKIKEFIDCDFDKSSNNFNFKGGAIGYIGYNAVGFYEKRLEFQNEDELNIPIVRFNFYKRYIAYDHFKHKVYVVDNIFPEDKRGFLEIDKEQREYFNSLINKGIHIEEEKAKDIEINFKFSKSRFIEAVNKAKEYIKNGDIFQVVLSERMSSKTEKSPIEIYRRLREENPSPYMYLIDYGIYQVIGSSPEILVSVKDKKVTTNPIAGTRKRGAYEEEDLKLEEELLKDEKELAEHVMLVDLGRNDIGKVSEIGKVNVDSFMKVERFSHVMHITSTVSGILKEDKDAFDALGACMPAGTVSGAPKIRAMEIIEELEEVDRGIYSGAVGYFSYGGNMDMAIAIRTIILKNKIAYVQAGAGIVYDSKPEMEAEEIQNKLLVLKEALK